MSSKSLLNGSLKGIAIIGMAVRVPGAKNVKEFWHNLTHGIESLSTFSDEDLIESVDIGSIRNESNFAKVGGVLS
jgi:acyl transferase domain-containing protein